MTETEQAISDYAARHDGAFPCGHRVSEKTAYVTIATRTRGTSVSIYPRVRCILHHRKIAARCMAQRRQAERGV